MEVHTSRELPQSLPIELQNNNQSKSKRNNTGLDPQRILSSHSSHPRNLLISNNKSTKRSPKINPSRDLSRSFRVYIKQISIDTCSADQDPENEEPPGDGDDHVMPCILESIAEKNYADDHEGGGEPDRDETGFGFEVPVVAFAVDFSGEIEDEVTGDFTEDCGNDWGEKVES